MNAVFEIRRSDGHVLWKLGGTPVNKDGAAIIAIQDDPEGGPVGQHDARYVPDGTISMFDNQTSQPARGIEYAVDVGARTAHPVFSYVVPEQQASCCMGDVRVLPDGHRVIGWGYLAGTDRAMTELDAAGHSVLDLGLGTGVASYRAVKVPTSYFDLDVLRADVGR